MRWSDLLRMSVSSLRRRKLRTFLTVLGVVIGTASIVVMISLGLGLQESMYKEVEQNGGTTSITVTGKDSGGMMYGYSGMSSDEEESQKYITDDVIKELKNVAHVKSAEPILSISVIALKGKYEGFIELTGMTPEGLKTLNLELEDGGRLPDPNSAQLELVYGNTVITNFYEKTSGRGYWAVPSAAHNAARPDRSASLPAFFDIRPVFRPDTGCNCAKSSMGSRTDGTPPAHCSLRLSRYHAAPVVNIPARIDLDHARAEYRQHHQRHDAAHIPSRPARP